MFYRFPGVCLLLLLCGLPMESQTLAHPGLRGNGIAPQAWWTHASFVRFGSDTTFADVAKSLDAMALAGIDSVILPDLEPAADASQPFDGRFGTQDDLDALLREASARRMHVVLSIPVTRLSAGGDEVRFWMSRGLAGFDAGSVSPGDLSVLRGVRSAMARFPGERILMARTPIEAAISGKDELRRDPVTLQLVTSSAASSLGKHAAVEVASLDDTSPPNAALIFRAGLLQGEGGPEKIRAIVTERGRHRLSRLR